MLNAAFFDLEIAKLRVRTGLRRGLVIGRFAVDVSFCNVLLIGTAVD